MKPPAPVITLYMSVSRWGEEYCRWSMRRPGAKKGSNQRAYRPGSWEDSRRGGAILPSVRITLTTFPEVLQEPASDENIFRSKTDGARPLLSNLFARNPCLRAKFIIRSNARCRKGIQIGARGTRVVCVYVELGLGLLYGAYNPASACGGTFDWAKLFPTSIGEIVL